MLQQTRQFWLSFWCSQLLGGFGLLFFVRFVCLLVFVCLFGVFFGCSCVCCCCWLVGWALFSNICFLDPFLLNHETVLSSFLSLRWLSLSFLQRSVILSSSSSSPSCSKESLWRQSHGHVSLWMARFVLHSCNSSRDHAVYILIPGLNFLKRKVRGEARQTKIKIRLKWKLIFTAFSYYTKLFDEILYLIRKRR